MMKATARAMPRTGAPAFPSSRRPRYGRLARDHDVDGEEQEHGEHDDEGHDGPELPAQVGIRPFADGIPDDPHGGGPVSRRSTCLRRSSA